MLIDLGVNAIAPMDPSGIDYRDCKKRYGTRLTLVGNIYITWPLVEGTPADVEHDVREHSKALKPGGRWVAASSHSIVNWIPHDNLITMINILHKEGVYSGLASSGSARTKRIVRKAASLRHAVADHLFSKAELEPERRSTEGGVSRALWTKGGRRRWLYPFGCPTWELTLRSASF